MRRVSRINILAKVENKQPHSPANDLSRESNEDRFFKRIFLSPAVTLLLILSILTFGSVTAADEQFTIIGAVYNLARNQLSVKTPRGSFMIPPDDRTTVKDKTYGNLSAFKIGDEVSVRCRPDASGKPVAMKI